MDLGNRIQALRKRLGLSQEALAQRLNVSRQAIGKWETGATLPSIDNLLELSEILNTTVDFLLTGREAAPLEYGTDQAALEYDAGQAVPPKYGAEQPQSISMDALRSLLAEQQTEPPRKRRLRRILAAACAACMLLVLCLLGYYITRLGALEETVSGLNTSMNTLDSQMQGALSSIQSGIEESLSQQASILSASDCSPGDYDADTQTAAFHLSATPKTLTEDTALCFVLSPMASSQDTLAQPITAEGHIPAAEGPSPGAFTAEVQVPMVQDFVVSVLLTQNGVQHTETLSEQYGFSSMYVCTLTAETSSFSWSASSSGQYTTVALTGCPSICITPAAAANAPKPDTLLCELYINGTLMESDEIDVFGEFFSDKAEQSLGTGVIDAYLSSVTYYPSPQDDRSYRIDGDPDGTLDVCWSFTLTDTAGYVYTDAIR